MKTILYNTLLCCLIILAWAGIIYLWQWREDMEAWADQPGFVYGPANWREKLKECDRRAILINGYVDYVEDDRYCIVKIGG